VDRAWHAEVNGGDAGQPPGLVSFLAEESKGQVDAHDFTEPAFVLRSAPARLEVVFDLVEARHHFRINGEHGASQAGVLVLAGGSVGTGASSELDLALVEVFLEP
jgi:hypothetical protein